jgi:hypothetical protein
MSDIEARVIALESVLEQVRARNARVESDKAWETSLTRKLFVAGLTFIFTAIVFRSLSVPSPFTNAFIPVTGYIVSTFTIPWAKQWWLTKRDQKELK